MKQTISEHDFCDAFRIMKRLENFSYAGRKALFAYFEEYEEDSGEEVELDVIAICCDFSEYASIEEAATEHGYMNVDRSKTGTISRATMRPQDLIPCFLDKLSEVDPGKYSKIVGDYHEGLARTEKEEDCDWWDSEDAGYLLEELFEALDAMAPANCYFGSHPGDGSDYGYWRVEIDEQDALEWLQDRTTVIEHGSGVIIQSF